MRRTLAAAALSAGLAPEVRDPLVVGVLTSTYVQRVWRQWPKAMAERVLTAELTHHRRSPEGRVRGPDSIAAMAESSRGSSARSKRRVWPSSPSPSPSFRCIALHCIACDDARPRRRTTQGLSRALGVPLDDTKEVVGAWIAPTERAAVWHRVCREWQGRRVTDITLVLIDGLTGRPDARQTVVPHPVVHRASRAPASARWVVDRADARRSHDAGGCSGADRSRRASRFAAPCRALR